ncbi:MAG: hypothetical protein O2V44_10230 [Candidatus Bathyarchaeota archaeon]|jgi:uncharacterized membrane protein|nr:hypothetical protein [Candidatus Bathyarchaeota archaeon]
MANKMSEEERYEVEKKRIKLYRNILEPIIMALMIVGIITAALDVSFGGFAPIFWFVLAFGWVLIIICMEVTMMRVFLERKK